MKFNIAFATDENYIQHLAVAIQSLLSNNDNLYFNIYIINGGIDKEKLTKLIVMTKNYQCKLINIEINDSIFESLVTNHHFTKANYYRLLIPNFINEDKVLYLDADIVVNKNIESLYNQDLEDSYIGAVLNPGFDRHKELKMDINSNYFNSGVMLINNKKWKEDSITKKVIKFVEANQEVIHFVDQCGLNAIINGKWKEIELKYNQQAVIYEQEFLNKYNCFSQQNLNEAKNNPVIIHYTGSSKPWNFRNKHPYKDLYWKYLKMTPFKRYIPEDLTVINVIKWMIPQSVKKFTKGQK